MDLHQHIKDEYNKRRSRNFRYSVRAFANDLGISKSALSKTLRGESHLSRRNQEIVAKHLGVPLEIEELSSLLLSEAEFSQISDWYHFAILSLAKIPDTKADPSYVAERLGLSLSEAEQALNTLQNLELISIESGILKRTEQPLNTTNQVPSQSLRKFHSQNLQRADQVLYTHGVEERDYQSATMAIDPVAIDKVKNKIDKFLDKLMASVENEGTPKEVYTIAIQFFPQSKIGDEK